MLLKAITLLAALVAIQARWLGSRRPQWTSRPHCTLTQRHAPSAPQALPESVSTAKVLDPHDKGPDSAELIAENARLREEIAGLHAKLEALAGPQAHFLLVPPWVSSTPC